MSKGLFIGVFIALIIFMISDVIYKFGDTTKGIVYGISFIIGLVIYIYNYFTTKKEKDSEEIGS